MKILVAATALAVVAAAVPVFGPVQQAKAQGYSQDQTTVKKAKKAKKVKKAKAKTEKRALYRSPYSTNPAHDVYVNGNYAGSDPDPRIRATIRKEYCEDSLDGC